RGHRSHVLKTSWGMSPAILPKLAKLLRELDPNVVHTHDVKAEFAAIACRLVIRMRLVGAFYGRLAMQSTFLQLADLARFPAFRCFDRVYPNSSAQRDELRRFKFPDSRMEILPSFVSTTDIRPATAADRCAAREAFAIPQDAAVVATVAKLAINKGHTYMLQALPAICQKVPNILYLIVGEANAVWRGEGGIREDLQRQAESLGVANHVRFLGYVDDRNSVLHATDLAVSPSLLEGMQVAILEMMAAGLPLVATAIGGTPDAVVDGETGVLVPPKDPQALSEAIIPLLKDRDKLQAMGARARQRAESHFDANIVADRFLRSCQQLLD
ncbi:MAG: glycosyltransferase family 4 protein, partial [Planctomycetales bacterium]|nr:glycosyltransferase family 4 protein [Planctomycetales bacterium]